MHPKHVFANPCIPEICPILTLGIYMLLMDFSNSPKVFPGNNQQERFRQYLDRMTEIPAVSDALMTLGFDRERLGIHSTRKGAATFCANGCTSAPSQASIDLRGGWSQGKIKDVYQHSLPVGDQYVGRVVTGLPRYTTDFALLPPHFKENCNEAFITDAIQICFPSIPRGKKVVCRFVLASLVHHSDHLRRNLPANHLIFETVLFRQDGLLDGLKPMIDCRLPRAQDHLQATGIPTDVMILESVRQVPERVDDLLQTRSVLAGQVTPDFFATQMEGVYTQIRAIIGASPIQENPARPAASNNPVHDFSSSDEHITILPADYKIPRVITRVIWEHWWLGDSQRNIPALVKVPSYMVPRSQRKKFGELQFVMQVIARILGDEYDRNPTTIRVSEMFQLASPRLDELSIPRSRATNRNGITQRRVGQLLWTTVAKNLRLNGVTRS